MISPHEIFNGSIIERLVLKHPTRTYQAIAAGGLQRRGSEVGAVENIRVPWLWLRGAPESPFTYSHTRHRVWAPDYAKRDIVQYESTAISPFK